MIDTDTFKIFISIILCLHMFACMYMCMCTICMPGAHRSHKQALDPMELELGMVWSHHVSPGDQIQVLCKSSKRSKPLSHLQVSDDKYFKQEFKTSL